MMEWTELRPLAETGQIGQLLMHARVVSDPGERIAFCQSLIRNLAFDEWNPKDFDIMTAVADYAIDQCEGLGGDSLEAANVIAYSTSANLCDCWGDDFDRKPRHFKKGIEYARKALWLRSCLGKGPGPEAMATWALGKHQLSLGRTRDAAASFRKCLQLETVAANEAGLPASICLEASDTYLIAAAYVALMQRDRRTLAALREVVDEMATSGGEAKTDAEIISSQLRETAKTIDATLWPA